MEKKRIGLLLSGIMLLAALLSGCGKEAEVQKETEAVTEAVTEAATVPETAPETVPVQEAEDVIIVYTNDIHSYIYNTVTDADQKTSPGLRLSKVKAMIDDLRAEGKQVLFVDCGDEVQGSAYGSIDEGESVIGLMNASGCMLASVGNHEFDYGMDRFMELAGEAEYPFISCNFRKEGELVFPETKIFTAGGRKIAFVGISTPETISSSTPGYFQNEKGEFIYSFDGGKDAEELYESVQKAIDSVKDEADVVIAIGHLGVDQTTVEKGWSSRNVIAHTEGLSAFIDGHSHTTIIGEAVKDKSGKDVLLTQTGSYLAAAGVMTVSAEGEVTTELLTDYERTDETVAELEEKLEQKVQTELGQKVGVLENTLYIYDPDHEGMRLVRSREMNTADFVTDAIYWYFSMEKGMDCDLVLQNSGGVRTQTEAGEVTCFDFKNIAPFGNQLCLKKLSGQNILDALEMGARCIGNWDSDRGIPEENGGFLQVAGLKYTVDASVESTVKTDETSSFLSVDGERRVKDVKVYDRETGTYVDLDPEKTYTVGGISYVVNKGGDGMTMLKEGEIVLDFAGQDSDVLVSYAKSFAEKDGEHVICTEGSPLASLPGYEIDYADPFGAGRITIINTSY